MSMEKRKPWSMDPKIKEKIKKMRAETDLTLIEIAKELEQPISTIQNVLYAQTKSNGSKIYYIRNRERLLKQMKEYHKLHFIPKKLRDGKDNRPNDTGGVSSV